MEWDFIGFGFMGFDLGFRSSIFTVEKKNFKKLADVKSNC